VRYPVVQPANGEAIAAQTGVLEPAHDAPNTLSRRIALIWLAGMFVTLPAEMLKLPFNVTLVDVWVAASLPLIWLSIPRGRQAVSLYYVVPMWLIFVGSFASMFVAPALGNSLIVLLKEVFAFVWFITLAVVLVRLNSKDLRRIFMLWSAVVLAHGALIVAQFLWPELWYFMGAIMGRAQHEIYRPSGMFSNANAAAFFQLLGFVPLLLARLPRRQSAILGLSLLATMLATGSMGAVVSFVGGWGAALAVLAAKGHYAAIARGAVRLAVAGVLIGGLALLVISQNERYQTHLQRIIIGRAGRSSESRFDLWERGADVIARKDVFLWGVGPENFRVVDGQDDQLHNDFLAFAVERGLVSTLGLGLFALLAMIRAVNVFLLAESARPAAQELAVAVLLAAMVAAFVYSLTHQVFHNRQLWIILAFQEALYFKLANGRA
jgi:hypothetical protein